MTNPFKADRCERRREAYAVLDFLQQDRLFKEPLWRIKGSVHYDALVLGISEILDRADDERELTQ